MAKIKSIKKDIQQNKKKLLMTKREVAETDTACLDIDKKMSLMEEHFTLLNQIEDNINSMKITDEEDIANNMETIKNIAQVVRTDFGHLESDDLMDQAAGHFTFEGYLRGKQYI